MEFIAESIHNFLSRLNGYGVPSALVNVVGNP